MRWAFRSLYLFNILKAEFEGLIDDNQNILAGEEAKEKYKTLHSSPGYIRLLCFTVFIFVKDPSQLHRFSSFLWNMEEILHESRKNIFVCLRCKLGSDEIASKVFDNLDQPGWFRRKLNFDPNYFIKNSPFLFKVLLPIFKIFLLTWDVVKDTVLWIFLYSRISFLLDSRKINGHFVVCLIWFNLVTILFAQCMMGAYILRKANKIIKIPESLGARGALYCILVLMLPFVPCILLLQVTNIATQESEHVLQWHEASNSPSSVAGAKVVGRSLWKFSSNSSSVVLLLCHHAWPF